jgi:hypothetical protein
MTFLEIVFTRKQETVLKAQKQRDNRKASNEVQSVATANAAGTATEDQKKVLKKLADLEAALKIAASNALSSDAQIAAKPSSVRQIIQQCAPWAQASGSKRPSPPEDSQPKFDWIRDGKLSGCGYIFFSFVSSWWWVAEAAQLNPALHYSQFLITVGGIPPNHDHS